MIRSCLNIFYQFYSSSVDMIEGGIKRINSLKGRPGKSRYVIGLLEIERQDCLHQFLCIVNCCYGKVKSVCMK